MNVTSLRYLTSRIGAAAGMRYLAVLAMVLVGFIPARANVMEFTYSGTFGSTLGVIQAGDAFSGDITFDTTPGTNACPGNLVYAWCLPLLTDVLTLPSADGLSIPPLTPEFAGLPEITKGVVDFSTGDIQINVNSSVDGKLYEFFFSPGGGGVLDNFTDKGELSASFASTGPTAVPEPGSLSLAALVLLLLVPQLIRLRGWLSVPTNHA